ncbi:MAG TPA: MoaF C-terminal domain-containing protein [Solirubrobacteraceae bacterium]|nr:MoaF C-terminal domain-containing protein [Solirubrobacteraceae bacterium]
MTPSAPLEGPATDLIPLAEQFDNHDEYRPPATDVLAGRTLALDVEGGPAVRLTFATAGRLTWTASPASGGAGSGTETYEAVELRPDVLLVVIDRPAERVSVLAIADLARSRALLNVTRLLTGPAGEVVEDTRYLQARIDGGDGAPFPRTTELVGKRVHHRYSSTHAFEHIYLNASTYAYQGLEGPERGVADVDATDAFLLGDGLYLFSWHERAQPLNGAIALDLVAGRAYGRLFGWDRHQGAALRIRTGSIATLLNETTYEGL